MVEKWKEVIVLDTESDEPCANSSVEESRGDDDRFRVQQPSFRSIYKCSYQK